MLRTPILAALVLAATLLLGLTGNALAHTTSGGTSAPMRPQIERLQCETGEEDRCPEGEFLRVDGEFLESTSAVVFLGGRGRADNRKASPSEASAHEVVVRVPVEAESGPVRVKASAARASRTGPSIEVDADPVVAGEDVFPVDGAYDFGTADNGFGGGRNHQGQDVLADCGTPVRAVRAGRVDWVRWQDAAGNYAVITAADGTSQAYMHLLKPAPVKQGQRVMAGQQIGQVGQTGRASACHLHFELWTAPGWYRGGEAVDPLPLLRGLGRGE
jgi:murein DD-endopeptidase MepM/ murein hydrolase activator NlpD